MKKGSKLSTDIRNLTLSSYCGTYKWKCMPEQLAVLPHLHSAELFDEFYELPENALKITSVHIVLPQNVLLSCVIIARKCKSSCSKIAPSSLLLTKYL
uniref:Secreted protein n=1 Tax=Parascaris univalens TaxID=6257 RepID=A0A915BWF6_PARUN